MLPVGAAFAQKKDAPAPKGDKPEMCVPGDSAAKCCDKCKCCGREMGPGKEMAMCPDKAPKPCGDVKGPRGDKQPGQPCGPEMRKGDDGLFGWYYQSLSDKEKKAFIAKVKAHMDEMEAKAEEKRAEMEKKRKEFEEKWANFDNLSLEEQEQMLKAKATPRPF